MADVKKGVRKWGAPGEGRCLFGFRADRYVSAYADQLCQNCASPLKEAAQQGNPPLLVEEVRRSAAKIEISRLAGACLADCYLGAAGEMSGKPDRLAFAAERESHPMRRNAYSPTKRFAGQWRP